MTLQGNPWSPQQIVARLVPGLHDAAQSLRPLI